jgi:hypothetical protein
MDAKNKLYKTLLDNWPYTKNNINKNKIIAAISNAIIQYVNDTQNDPPPPELKKIELKGSFSEWVGYNLECGFTCGNKNEAKFLYSGIEYFATLYPTQIEVAEIQGPLYNYQSKNAKNMTKMLNNIWNKTFKKETIAHDVGPIPSTVPLTNTEYIKNYEALKQKYRELLQDYIELSQKYTFMSKQNPIKNQDPIQIPKSYKRKSACHRFYI